MYLNNHVQPPSVLPSTFSHGNNMKFNLTWLVKYPWLRYVPMLDGVFCGPLCYTSYNSEQKTLVNRPFCNWVKISETLSNHSKHQYHHECLQDADILKSTVVNPALQIDVITSTSHQIRINENRHILRQIVSAALFLSKQGIHFMVK